MIKNIKNVVFLNRFGEIIHTFPRQQTKRYLSNETFPVNADFYPWDKKRQLEFAEKYKDQIKRVFYPSTIDKKVKNMLQDDVRRLALLKKMPYQKKVLEVGCSDGSVSIKIAQNRGVRQVLGIDLRSSAISDGKKLIRNLIRRGEIDQQTAKKVILKKLAIEEIKSKTGQFDSICAYEVFEHLVPQELLPSFLKLYRLLKKNGSFFISVPNRFCHPKYEKLGRSRWRWHDHKNFFSQLSLEMFLNNFFKKVKFYPLYSREKVKDSIYLIVQCRGKKYGT